jgi:hypothetical protein
VQLEIGSSLAGEPGWNQEDLTRALVTALDATAANNNFMLTNFTFPNIQIDVGSGQQLVLNTTDALSTDVRPEPAALPLSAIGLLTFIGLIFRKCKLE